MTHTEADEIFERLIRDFRTKFGDGAMKLYPKSAAALRESDMLRTPTAGQELTKAYFPLSKTPERSSPCAGCRERDWRLVFVLALCFVLFLLCLVASAADDVELQPKYPDAIPHDGWWDAGTRTNPYVVERGQDQFEVKSKWPTRPRSDGYFAPGTRTNPYVITPTN